MNPFLQRSKNFPHFLYLFPLFFVFHNFVQNRNAVTAVDFLELYAEYLLATFVLFGICLWQFKNRNKAAIAAFAMMFFHFFFGAVQYGLKHVSNDFFLAKYSILLPLSLALFVLLFIFLKRTNRSFNRFALYLNAALLLLLLTDVPAFFKGGSQQSSSLVQLRLCDTCAKPDVYFIIADEYADSTSLSQAFDFNNHAFLASLRSYGFHINHGRAAYNFTQYAVASLYQMNYLPGIDRRNSSKKDINTCYGAINQNELLTFFQKSGYEMKNFSLFNLANIPAKAEYKFVPMGKTLISSQTFLQRIQRDLGYHLVTTLKLKSAIARYAYYARENNEKLLQLLRDETARQSAKPRFIFTHIEMPHYPYYYDSSGHERPLEFLVAGNEANKAAYVDYLYYANGVFLRLMDAILKQSSKPPVIVFMGDHGFREFGNNDPGNEKYYFMNFNSVYLPNKNYAAFYDGISGVNQFRAVMNAAFGQRLPMLKDSSVLIVD